MAFFKRKHKKYAKELSNKSLGELYRRTEVGLKNAVASGDEKAMKQAMANHQAVEYAMLYKHSPEFKEKQRSKKHGKF